MKWYKKWCKFVLIIKKLNLNLQLVSKQCNYHKPLFHEIIIWKEKLSRIIRCPDLPWLPPIYIYKNISLIVSVLYGWFKFHDFWQHNSLCIVSITHFTEQAETIQWMKGKQEVIEAYAGGDRRKLEVTVGAQVMTDEGKGGQGMCTEDN